MTSFTKFNRLPQELQLQVWEHAANSHFEEQEPTAHFTDFWSTLGRGTELLLKVTSHVSFFDESLTPPDYPLHAALMWTCRNSRATMSRIARNWMPRNSLSLEYMKRHTIRHYTHMRFRIPPKTWAGGESELIDTSHDLIIACRPPVFTSNTMWGGPTTFPKVQSIGVLYEYEPPSDKSQHPLSIFTSFRDLKVLLRIFPGLRVLYILVKPQDTIEPMAGPPRLTDCMMYYYRAYEETAEQVPPKIFHARQRIYYEPPKAITVGMCTDLEKAIHMVRLVSFLVRRRNTEMPQLAIRVMTWKDARGARGRFDIG